MHTLLLNEVSCEENIQFCESIDLSLYLWAQVFCHVALFLIVFFFLFIINYGFTEYNVNES